MTKPDGWHPLKQTPQHAMRDGLYMGGECRATVEAFFDDGPWYANALTSAGELVRYGACESNEGAVAWCERATGYRPSTRALPLSDPKTASEGRDRT